MPKLSSISPVLSIQYRFVTDGQTDGHTTTAYTRRATIASRGKKMIYEILKNKKWQINSRDYLCELKSYQLLHDSATKIISQRKQIARQFLVRLRSTDL